MEPTANIIFNHLDYEALRSYETVTGSEGIGVLLNVEMANGFLRYLVSNELIDACDSNTLVCLICGGPFVTRGDLCRCYESVPGCFNPRFFVSNSLNFDVVNILESIKVNVKSLKRRNARFLLEASACGAYSATDLDIIYKLQAGLCYYCMVPVSRSGKGKCTIDHIEPLSLGGSNWPFNIALTCKGCNSKKSWTSESVFLKKVRCDKSVAWVKDHKEFISFIKRHKRREFASSYSMSLEDR